jgi:hypothetical protein
MKITLKRLSGADAAIKRVISRVVEFKAAYRLRRTAGKISNELDRVQETHNEMVKRYGEEIKTKGPKGEDVPTGSWRVKPENDEAYTKEWKDFLAQEIKIDVDQIPLTYLVGQEFSAMELAAIDEFLPEMSDKELEKLQPISAPITKPAEPSQLAEPRAPQGGKK